MWLEYTEPRILKGMFLVIAQQEESTKKLRTVIKKVGSENALRVINADHRRIIGAKDDRDLELLLEKYGIILKKINKGWFNDKVNTYLQIEMCGYFEKIKGDKIVINCSGSANLDHNHYLDRDELLFPNKVFDKARTLDRRTPITFNLKPLLFQRVRAGDSFNEVLVFKRTNGNHLNLKMHYTATIRGEHFTPRRFQLIPKKDILDN